MKRFVLTIAVALAAVLSSHSGYGNSLDTGRTYDVLHYVMRLSFDHSAKSVMGDATIRLTPLDKPLEIVVLDARDLRYEFVGFEGSPDQLSYVARDGKLVIPLPRKFEKGEIIEFRIRYSATPKKGIYFVEPLKDNGKTVRSAQVWTQGEAEETHHWLPSYDFPDDKATTEQIITAGKGETVIGNGRLVERNEKPDGTQVFHYRMDVPHSLYLTSFVIGEYVKIEDKYRDIPLGYYVYPGQESVVTPAYGKTKKMFRVFEDLTGVKYQFNKYDQTMVAEFPWGGMENITATTMADTEIMFAKFKFGQALVEDLVAHELAHSWFGNLVTCRNWEELWLNEGFATFMEAVFRENEYGRANYDAKIRQDAAEYMAYESGPGVVSHGLYNTKADPENDDSMFDTITYQKGGVVIHMLREEIGNEAFWKGVNLYLERHKFDTVGTEDLRSVMEDASERDLGWFFDQWVRDSGYPKLKIVHRYDAAKKELVLDVSQTQKPGSGVPEAFRLPLEIGFRTGAGPKLEKVTVRSRTQEIRIPAATRPTAITVDPANKVALKTVSLTTKNAR